MDRRLKQCNFKSIISVVILLLLLLIIGPLNMIHGMKRESTIRGELPDFVTYDISNNDFVQEFSPKYAHVKALDVLFLNTGNANSGKLYACLRNEKGKVIFEKEYDISEITPGEWVKIDFNCKLKSGNVYNLLLKGKQTESPVYALVINGSLDVNENMHCYVNGESVNGGVAIGYYYNKTFSLVSRLIICVAIFSIILLLLKESILSTERKLEVRNYLWCDGDLTVKAYWVCLALLLGVTIFMHIYKIASLPFGINIDEMGMGYDAYCLANYGVDRYLLSWPVYLINWGSGQNALYTFSAAILIKIFGYSVTVLRIPIICNAFLLWYFGLKIIKMKWKKRSSVILYATLFLVIPEFLILTRYGLESLLMLGLSTVFIYTLLYAVEKEKWYWHSIAGVCGGIMLYTYAISYVVTIVFLLLSILYLIRIGKCKISKLFALGIPLGILAFPLILEQLIGIFDLPQMKIGIFTISKMPYRYRGGDINFKHVPEDFVKTIYTIFIGDDTDYSSILSVQTFYWMSIPYIIIGIIYETFRSIIYFKKKIWDTSVFIVLWFWCMFGIGCIMGGKGPTCFRLNGIYFCVLFFLMSGIMCSVNVCRQQKILYFGVASKNCRSEHSISISQKVVKVTGCLAMVLTVIYFAYFVDLYFYERAGSCYTLNWNTYEEPLQVLQEQGEAVAGRITYLPDVKSIYTAGTFRPSPYEYDYEEKIAKRLDAVLNQKDYEVESYYKNYVIYPNEYDMGNVDLNANYVVYLQDRDKVIQFEKLGFKVMQTSTHYVCFR